MAKRASRRGAAVTEMILVMPVLIVIFFGSIEACNLMFLQQAITEAAYDGALRGVSPGSTASEVETSVTQMLAARNITTSSVQVGQGAILLESVPPGELFTVNVAVTTKDHLISPMLFATFAEIDVEMTARKN